MKRLFERANHVIKCFIKFDHSLFLTAYNNYVEQISYEKCCNMYAIQA